MVRMRIKRRLCRMTANLPLLLVLAIQNLSAQNQAPSTQPGWPCVAGRAIDPAYVQTAEATGGQVFLFDRTEAARSMVLVQHSHKHDETIFRSTGTLMTGSREFNFPVDSTVESLMLSVTLQCLQSITVSPAVQYRCPFRRAGCRRQRLSFRPNLDPHQAAGGALANPHRGCRAILRYGADEKFDLA